MSYVKYLTVAAVLFLTACSARYTTPGGGSRLNDLADTEINEIMSQQPAAFFPAHIAVARIQSPNYRSYRTMGYGNGRYSVVTTRDVEGDTDFERLSNMPQVAQIAPISKILISEELDSLKALREAAARMKADVLMVYTFDTSFHVGEQVFAPLNVISLGFLANKEVTVTTTASAAFFDVRTEYLYGLAEASAQTSEYASSWGKKEAIDDLRVEAEKAAFKKLLPQIEATWSNIADQYSK